MISIDNISTLCIPIVAAVLGISFPIIIQIISKIDAKFNSLRLVRRFKKENLYKQLWISLIISVVALFYNNLFFFPWKYDLGFVVNSVMSNSSNILVLISSIYLISILFAVVYELISYFDYSEYFVDILKDIKSNKVKKKRINEEDIRDLAELAKFAIPKDDNETLGDFYQLLHDYSREKSSETTQELEYDTWYYDIILMLNETVCRENIRSISIVNGSDLLKLLVLNSPESIIPTKTYIVLWRALDQLLFYKKREWVYDYWGYVYQYRWLNLKPIRKEYNYEAGPPAEVLNNHEVEKRDKQIERFDEFHSAFCGYILYLKEYQLLKDIVSYSQSEPYQFPLVPSTLIDIVNEFQKLNGFDKPFHFQNSYPFRGAKGVTTGDVSLGWYKRYLTLLLFRLNSFQVNYMASYINPWDEPSIPNKLNEASFLKSTIEQMRYFVTEWRQKKNAVIINELGWSIEKGDNDPLIKLDDFLDKLNKRINEKRESLQLNKQKVKQFDKRTLEIIDSNTIVYRVVLKECKQKAPNLIKDVINTSFSQKMEKETFSNQSRSTHLNFDEIMAESMVNYFIHFYSLSFYKHKKRYYTINSDDMFAAIDKLLVDNIEEYVVLVFGFSLDYYLSGDQIEPGLCKVKEVNNRCIEYSYKDNLNIYSLPSTGNELMDHTLVVIKRDDLPCYVNYEPPEETKEKFKLELIDKELNLYTSVLFKDFPEKYKELEGSKFCLATIYYCVQIYWEKDADVTILKTITRYLDSGKGMYISDLPKLG